MTAEPAVPSPSPYDQDIGTLLAPEALVLTAPFELRLPSSDITP